MNSIFSTGFILDIVRDKKKINSTSENSKFKKKKKEEKLKS